MQTLIEVRFNWKDERERHVIKYIDSLTPTPTIAAKAVSTIIRWIGCEWLREHIGANGRPADLPHRLQV